MRKLEEKEEKIDSVKDLNEVRGPRREVALARQPAAKAGDIVREGETERCSFTRRQSAARQREMGNPRGRDRKVYSQGNMRGASESELRMLTAGNRKALQRQIVIHETLKTQVAPPN